jgi:hypothetical protein
VPSARLFPLVLVAALLASGCGSSDDQAPTATATTPPAPPGAAARACGGTAAGAGQLRVTGIGCEEGRAVVAAWAGDPVCSGPADASRFSCAVHDGYRCLGAATARGIAVSCSRPGSSVAFVAKRS